MTLEEQKEHAETVLNNINAVLEGRATHDIENYQIAGRIISKTPIADLLKISGYYNARLTRIKQAERRRLGSITIKAVC